MSSIIDSAYTELQNSLVQQSFMRAHPVRNSVVRPTDQPRLIHQLPTDSTSANLLTDNLIRQLHSTYTHAMNSNWSIPLESRPLNDAERAFLCSRTCKEIGITFYCEDKSSIMNLAIEVLKSCLTQAASQTTQEFFSKNPSINDAVIKKLEEIDLELSLDAQESTKEIAGHEENISSYKVLKHPLELLQKDHEIQSSDRHSKTHNEGLLNASFDLIQGQVEIRLKDKQYSYNELASVDRAQNELKKTLTSSIAKKITTYFDNYKEELVESRFLKELTNGSSPLEAIKRAKQAESNLTGLVNSVKRGAQIGYIAGKCATIAVETGSYTEAAATLSKDIITSYLTKQFVSPVFKLSKWSNPIAFVVSEIFTPTPIAPGIIDRINPLSMPMPKLTIPPPSLVPEINPYTGPMFEQRH